MAARNLVDAGSPPGPLEEGHHQDRAVDGLQSAPAVQRLQMTGVLLPFIQCKRLETMQDTQYTPSLRPQKGCDL